jgi:protein phosphatase 1L
MEDRTLLCARPGVTLAAVFDGHNGDAAAEHCRAHIGAALHRALAGVAGADGAVARALQAAFVDLHESFVHSAAADDSGCTALAALCLPGQVFVASAGDCRCALWRGEDELVALNVEHTAEVASERDRVQAAGAEVYATSDGKLRVGGVIQVTRCIGDRPLRHLGLSSEPEVTQTKLCDADRALILASDGLWDVLPDARVLHCLRSTAKSPDLIAKRLLTEALDRGTTDNTSVAVVFLRDLH